MDLREGLGYGLTRAACAIGFGAVPMLSERFGDAALSLVSFGLALLMIAIAGGLVRLGRPLEWRLAADAITLSVLIPVLVTASGIEVADDRLGGRSTNFLAAALATAMIYLVIVVVVTRSGADRNPSSQIGALPGALLITAILVGTSNFSAVTLWRGLSVAWMVAAIATALATLLSLRARALVAPLAFALFAAGIVVAEIMSESERSLSSGSSGIAVLVTGGVAVVLLLIPLPQRRSRLHQPPFDPSDGG